MQAISRETTAVINALAALFEAQRKEGGNPFENTGARYQGAVMTVHAYSWGDDAQPFNFAWRDIKVTWYKYWPRGAEINREPTPDELTEMLRECSAEILGAAKLINEPEMLQLAAKYGATHKPSLGVYQFFVPELMAFAHAMQAYRRPDNWTLITQEASPYYGKILTAKDNCPFSPEGTKFKLIGVMDAEDDYYYVVRDMATQKQQLMSCVGNLESWGFDLSSAQDPAMAAPEANPRVACAHEWGDNECCTKCGVDGWST